MVGSLTGAVAFLIVTEACKDAARIWSISTTEWFNGLLVSDCRRNYFGGGVQRSSTAAVCLS